ncbi:hypothetical protein CYMTET_30934 [Cymbomonas tetramitiformis]|uniref:NADP-dependent oxidoreductase domain-containing protein n=1 Tax=Cymbomonas tetramitiformis TaxID=36881 RepID=A0AAE0FHX7_9CHLO|nr:hypothetical protein CYMTET_30934 [Cymbomonas tetramitiformis]
MLTVCGRLCVFSLAPRRHEDAGNKAVTEDVLSVLKLMKLIGTFNGGKTVDQVALNYLICKGAIPIPGVKNAEQASEHAGALGWALDENEVATLDEKLDYHKL